MNYQDAFTYAVDKIDAPKAEKDEAARFFYDRFWESNTTDPGEAIMQAKRVGFDLPQIKTSALVERARKTYFTLCREQSAKSPPHRGACLAHAVIGVLECMLEEQD